MRGPGVMDIVVDQNPIAIIDIETTGLSPFDDRIVEVSVVRLEPGKSPFLAFDTLINPCGPVSATWVHGITDEDVADAPTFEAIASELLHVLGGCVVSAYNVYFDMRFLLTELERVGVALNIPYFCIMYLRCMLGMGRRCALHEACLRHGLRPEFSHASAPDALSATRILSLCIENLKVKGLSTYADIAEASRYKFCESFVYPPLGPPLPIGPPQKRSLRPRSKDRYRVFDLPHDDWQGKAQSYREALLAILSDLEVSEEDRETLAAKRKELNLTEQQAAMLHSEVMRTIEEDGIAKWRQKVRTCCDRLGVCEIRRRFGRYSPAVLRGPNPTEAVDAKAQANTLAGKTVAVTGTLEHLSRSQAEAAIKNAGGRATSSVSKSTDFVVVGSEPGSKAEKAAKLGVEIISESEFLRRLGRPAAG